MPNFGKLPNGLSSFLAKISEAGCLEFSKQVVPEIERTENAIKFLRNVKTSVFFEIVTFCYALTLLIILVPEPKKCLMVRSWLESFGRKVQNVSLLK